MFTAAGKLLLLLLAFTLAGNLVAAQDRIHKTNGDIVNARVTAASIIRVKYYNYASSDTVLHSIAGNMVNYIEYENGRIQTWKPGNKRKIEQRGADTGKKKLPIRLAYKPQGFQNVLTLNAPALTFIFANNDNKTALLGDFPAISGGIEYERFLNKSGLLSATIAGYFYMSVVSYKSFSSTTFLGYQLMPAFLYHPRGNTRLVDYSAGASLGMGRIHRDVTVEDTAGRTLSSKTNTNILALLGQFNLTLHHTKPFVLGIHLSGGPIISGSPGDRFMLQAGLKFGGRY